MPVHELVAEELAEYRECASRSSGIRNYESACAMLGVSLETALRAMAELLGGRFAGRPPGSRVELADLVKGARAAGWLPDMHPLGEDSDPLALMVEKRVSAENAGERPRGPPPPPAARPFHRAVTEDDFVACEAALSAVFQRLRDVLGAKREDKSVVAGGERLRATLERWIRRENPVEERQEELIL
jgi:hypothetical protein